MFNALSLSSYPPAQYNWQNVHSVDFVFKLNPHHSIEHSNPWPSTRRRKRRSWKPRHCPQVEPHLAIEFQLENQKTVSKILCDVPYCCSRDWVPSPQRSKCYKNKELETHFMTMWWKLQTTRSGEIFAASHLSHLSHLHLHLTCLPKLPPHDLSGAPASAAADSILL